MSASRGKCAEDTDAIQRCRNRFAEELDAIHALGESDVKVCGYLCQAFPPALAAGLGLRPVRLNCGVSALAESSGERHARADVCPLVKSLLGNISSRRGLHSAVSIWVGLLTCDQMRRALMSLTERFGLEVHPIQLPATRTDESAAYYARQMSRFVSDVTALHGLRFDQDEAMKWREADKAAASALMHAARSMNFSPLLVHEMFHLYFVSRPYGLEEFFEELMTSAPPFTARKRVVVAGSPVAYEDTVLYEVLDRSSISVLPLNCTGLNSVESDHRGTDHSSSTEQELALEAFWRAPCARARPNTGMHDRLKKNVESTGASGVILKCLKFCDLWHTERERVKAELGVPVLVLDSVYAAGERERLVSRVEAFVEAIQ